LLPVFVAAYHLLPWLPPGRRAWASRMARADLRHRDWPRAIAIIYLALCCLQQRWMRFCTVSTTPFERRGCLGSDWRDDHVSAADPRFPMTLRHQRQLVQKKIF